MSLGNSDDLPEGWSAVTLGELLQPGGLFDGPFGSNLKTSDYTESGVRVIRLENLANIRFVEDKRTFISETKYTTLTKHTVREGDILVGSFVDGEMRVCILPSMSTLAIAKADCFCVRPRQELVDARFLTYQLGSSRTRDELVGHIHGATRPRITTKQLRGFEVMVPPLSEQRRIVVAVERLLEKVDSARERLERVPKTMKLFRQAVLAAACSGQLTADWREANPNAASLVIPAYDPSSNSDEVPELPEYPEHWRMTSVGSCSELVQYGTSEKADPAGVVPLLRMGNIQDGRIVLDNLKFANEELPGLSSLLLESGDLLFNRTNSPELVGKSGVFESDERATFASYLIRIRCKPGSVDSRLLCWWLNSPWGREWAAKVRTDGVSQSNINGTKLQQMPISVPPLAEQEEIVRRGTALLALANAIEQKATSALRRVELLTQTILAKAFRGELVLTEAELARKEGRSYEPASELLARVKASVNGEAKRPRAKKASKRASSTGDGLLEFMEG